MPDQEVRVANGASNGADNGAVSDEVAHLLKAVESRDIIGQAKGILMERFKLNADEAFDWLRQASQHTNRKVVLIAQDLAATGEWPVPSMNRV